MKYFPNKLGRPPAVNNPDCETFHPRYTTTIGFIFATFFSYFGYINPIYRTNRGDFTLTRCCAVIFLIFVPAQPMPGICAYFIGTTVKSGQPNILDLRRRPPCRSNRYSSPSLGINNHRQVISNFARSVEPNWDERSGQAKNDGMCPLRVHPSSKPTPGRRCHH